MRDPLRPSRRRRRHGGAAPALLLRPVALILVRATLGVRMQGCVGGMQVPRCGADGGRAGGAGAARPLVEPCLLPVLGGCVPFRRAPRLILAAGTGVTVARALGSLLSVYGGRGA
jgi:hypothetical protein